MNPLLIAPSLLSADFAALGEEADAALAAGADWLHLDVMDGHFVPNITFGPAVVSALRRRTRATLDVHLMIAPVDPYVRAFAEAGADVITAHVEAGPHIHRTLQAIRAAGCKAGAAINPGTPLEAVEPLLGEVALVNVMTVNPGFGGQAFLRSQLPRIERLAAMIGERSVRIEVDGGITSETVRAAREAGADVMVAGSAVFGQPDYARAVRALRDAAEP